MKRPENWSRTEWGLIVAIGYVALVVLAMLTASVVNQLWSVR